MSEELLEIQEPLAPAAAVGKLMLACSEPDHPNASIELAALKKAGWEVQTTEYIFPSGKKSYAIVIDEPSGKPTYEELSQRVDILTVELEEARLVAGEEIEKRQKLEAKRAAELKERNAKVLELKQALNDALELECGGAMHHVKCHSLKRVGDPGKAPEAIGECNCYKKRAKELIAEQ